MDDVFANADMSSALAEAEAEDAYVTSIDEMQRMVEFGKDTDQYTQGIGILEGMELTPYQKSLFRQVEAETRSQMEARETNSHDNDDDVIHR